MKILMKIAAVLGFAMATPASADTIRVEGWTLTRDSTSCLLHATFVGGTTFSAYADSTKSIVFTLQNNQWTSLADKRRYNLNIEFDQLGNWPIEALALTKIDADGPGVMFSRDVKSNSEGDNFLVEFGMSRTITITGENGTRIDRLNLGGTYRASVALLDCMSRFRSNDPFAGITAK